jgi:hypothetical protein
MDTLCPRCQRYGTLRGRYQCRRCRQLLDQETCEECERAQQITAAAPKAGQPAFLDDPLRAATRLDLVDPRAPHPALAAGVGGAVFGATAGALAGQFFLGESPVIVGLIGLVVGSLVGALLGGNPSQGRR